MDTSSLVDRPGGGCIWGILNVDSDSAEHVHDSEAARDVSVSKDTKLPWWDVYVRKC
jgi:hypothetical protein